MKEDQNGILNAKKVVTTKDEKLGFNLETPRTLKKSGAKFE